MAKKEREGTEWGMIASGEGANRIAIQYLSEFQNKYMSDRILLFNTTASDIRPEKAFGSRLSPEFSSILQRIRKEKTCIFGSAPSGAGNVWKIGEDEAMKDFETIRRYVANSPIAQVDVILGLATLGGGTGNGSLPCIINQLKSKMPTTAHGNYIALGIWPLNSEASQRHFNAVCGFTRLLRYGEAGARNSEMMIIVHNSQVAELLNSSEKSDKFYSINNEIIRAVDMMIAPSGKSSEATIDIADYYQIPTSFGAYHFTPCVSWGNDSKIMGLEASLELAMRSPMCPVEEKTATMAYFIVRAPERQIKDGTFTQEGLEEASREISSRFMAGKHGGLVRYCSLSSKESGDGYDVMVLLGGFSLKKLLSGSIEKFRTFAENLKHTGDKLEVRDEDHPSIKASLKAEEIELLERWLREYSKKTENLIQKARKGGIGDEQALDDWLKQEERPKKAQPPKLTKPSNGKNGR
jgi:cell division GTPase FtsZ